jgi:hypothetical protein
MPAPYAPRFVQGKKLPVRNLPAVGDTVRQEAYGMGLGRLEDCGRTGTIIAVNRVKVVVDFGAFIGTQTVHPNVLHRLTQDEPAPAAVAGCLAGA